MEITIVGFQLEINNSIEFKVYIKTSNQKEINEIISPKTILKLRSLFENEVKPFNPKLILQKLTIFGFTCVSFRSNKIYLSVLNPT